MRNQQVLLKSRPEAEPSEDDFDIVERETPPLLDGQLLRRTLWLSIDPYMRGRMRDVKSYAKPAAIGEPMPGQTVAEVVESNDPAYRPGDIVLTSDGWQSCVVGDATGLRKLDPARGPVSYALGVLGMPGLTAYVALQDIAQARSGETVVVSAAAGAVGSVAGQIAKIKGCRAVGTAGSAEKCDWVTRELGFDACINYKTEDLKEALKAACPDGIDVYVDNVAGAVLDAVLRRINLHARIALVGLISEYNEKKPRPGPNLTPLLVNRATIRGMLVFDHTDRFPDFLRDMSQWLREGKVKVREDVIEGLENAPRAFLGLFRGENIGKRIVKVGV
jgi:NADPH-dependent curcumin reductase CurA